MKDTTKLFITLMTKRDAQISEKETLLILDLISVFGINVVSVASRYSITGDLSELSKLSMQISGFPKEVPSSLRSLLVDEKTAKTKFSQEQMNVSFRLRKASQPLPASFLLSMKFNGTQSIKDLWFEVVKNDQISDLEFLKISDLVRKFGPELVIWAMEFIGQSFGIFGHKFDLLARIIEASIKKDWLTINKIANSIGVNFHIDEPKAPFPYHMQILQFFMAKSGRMVSESEGWELWEITNRHPLAKIIFCMTAIPSSKFNIPTLEFALLDNLHKQIFIDENIVEDAKPQINTQFGEVNIYWIKGSFDEEIQEDDEINAKGENYAYIEPEDFEITDLYSFSYSNFKNDLQEDLPFNLSEQIQTCPPD